MTFNNDWSCPQCTLINSYNCQQCEACALARPALKSPPQEPECTKMVVHPTASPNEYAYSDPHYAEPTDMESDDEKGDFENKYVEEDAFAKRLRRRMRRRRRVIVGTTAGVVTGAVVFCGPWGAIIGGVAGGAATHAISKRQERKKDARLAAFASKSIPVVMH